ncbi:MAG: hypothetical protein MUC92_01560 [Fimbriimonadaceae bacterium]|nr:hypothetical protein [Fimbriimonadaceae bacterium]
MFTSLLLALSAGRILSVPVPDLFSESERAEIFAYWNQPGRYSVTSIADGKPGRYRAVYSPEASAWLLTFYRARANGKVKPTELPLPRNSEEAAWDRWIDQTMERDRLAATQTSERLNRGDNNATQPNLRATAPPTGLLRQFGSPPFFYKPGTPQTHNVTLSDFAAKYNEAVDVPRKYPYFRFVNGVNVAGSLPNETRLATMFRLVGMGSKEARVMAAVSRLEGGFDSINTYDTGFVSVGFIQFASLEEGRGSLGLMLAEYKRRDRRGFQRDFRKYGIDITSGGMLVVVDPRTARLAAGPDANQVIIRDKRLTAVFHRAGKVSEGYRLAQIASAARRFFPTNVAFSFNVNGVTLSGKLGDVIQSEAGLAILMDRYVNTGNLGSVPGVLQDVYQSNGVTTLAEARLLELQVLERIVYRRNFLTSGNLSRPSNQLALLAQMKAQPSLGSSQSPNSAPSPKAVASSLAQNKGRGPATEAKPPTRLMDSDSAASGLPRPDEKPPASGPVTNVGG